MVLCKRGISQFISKIKRKKVIVVGGADSECLEDIYISAKSFNLNPVYNHQYIYSAETGQGKN
jgi:hypothetical protein